jgi:hypothetical protein
MFLDDRSLGFCGVITRFFLTEMDSSNLMVLVISASSLAGILLLSLLIRAFSRHKAKLSQIASAGNMHH